VILELSTTSYYIGCLENKDEVCRFSPTSKGWKSVRGVVVHGLRAAQALGADQGKAEDRELSESWQRMG
jgi:hypothetical protein